MEDHGLMTRSNFREQAHHKRSKGVKFEKFSEKVVKKYEEDR